MGRRSIRRSPAVQAPPPAEVGAAAIPFVVEDWESQPTGVLDYGFWASTAGVTVFNGGGISTLYNDTNVATGGHAWTDVLTADHRVKANMKLAPSFSGSVSGVTARVSGDGSTYLGFELVKTSAGTSITGVAESKAVLYKHSGGVDTELRSEPIDLAYEAYHPPELEVVDDQVICAVDGEVLFSYELTGAEQLLYTGTCVGLIWFQGQANMDDVSTWTSTFVHGVQRNRSNTGLVGVGVSEASLTPLGSLTTTSHGQVIEGRLISGQITVQHNNVRIRKNKVLGDGLKIRVNGEGNVPSVGCIIEDNDFDGQGAGANSQIGWAGFTARRNYFYDCGEPIAPYGDCVVEDNVMEDFADFVAGFPPDERAHQDGVQVEFGDNVWVDRNKIRMNVDGANAAVWFSAGGGPWPGTSHPHINCRATNNWLSGGGDQTLGLGNQVEGTGNWISTEFHANGGSLRPIGWAGGTATKSGNRWADGPNAGEILDGFAA